jgi:hypothetical protein
LISRSFSWRTPFESLGLEKKRRTRHSDRLEHGAAGHSGTENVMNAAE